MDLLDECVDCDCWWIISMALFHAARHNSFCRFLKIQKTWSYLDGIQKAPSILFCFWFIHLLTHRNQRTLFSIYLLLLKTETTTFALFELKGPLHCKCCILDHILSLPTLRFSHEWILSTTTTWDTINKETSSNTKWHQVDKL